GAAAGKIAEPAAASRAQAGGGKTGVEIELVLPRFFGFADRRASAKRSLLSYELPEDVLQNPPVLVVKHLLRRVDTHAGAERARFSVRALGGNGYVPAAAEAGRKRCRQTDDRVDFLARKPQGGCRFSRQELQGQDAHADEIAAVDALVALGDDGADTQQ